MDKQPIVNINFTGITDYLRDKDLEIADLKSAKRYCESEASFYKSKYNGLNDKVQNTINYINEMCLTKDGYSNYGDDLRPQHIIDLLKGGDEK